MDQALIIVVFICGLAAMVLELFMPGAILGTIGFLASAGSIIYAYLHGHTVIGTVLLVLILAWLPAFFWLWKSVIGKYFALTEVQKDFKPSSVITEELMDKEGRAVSHLRPSGIALIDDKRYGVVTRGEMLEKGAHIKVIEVSGNRLVVKKL